MPPLRHQLQDEEFDESKSEVINWLSQQPEIRRAMFDYYRTTQAIMFDKDSGTWKGRDS